MLYRRNYPQPGAVRKGHWMLTSTGKKYWPLDPHPDDIDIHDIAHHLSLLCRFTGACSHFYSVAEHSVLVSELLEREDPKLAMLGLMHDATEAYLGDVGRPLKAHLPEYVAIENNNWLAIADHFGLPDDMPPSVKKADIDVFWSECDALGVNITDDGVLERQERYDRIKGINVFGLMPKAAEELFLLRYDELRHGNYL